jgi:hypothetical protein
MADHYSAKLAQFCWQNIEIYKIGQHTGQHKIGNRKMMNAYNAPKIHEIIWQHTKLWGDEPVSLERMIIVKSLAKARERRASDGCSETLLDGCKETIRILFDNIYPEAVNIAAKELEEWARGREKLFKLAEIHIGWWRETWFIESNMNEFAPEFAARRLPIDEDSLSKFPKNRQYENSNETFNRYISFKQALKDRLDISQINDLTSVVLACKRVGSDLLGWRY